MGSSQFNSDVAIGLRSGFQQGRIHLLQSEYGCEDQLRKIYKGYHNPDGLPRLLESDNIRNPWTHKRYRWMKPRPFMTNTQKDINKHNKDIVKMVEQRINHDNTK